MPKGMGAQSAPEPFHAGGKCRRLVCGRVEKARAPSAKIVLNDWEKPERGIVRPIGFDARPGAADSGFAERCRLGPLLIAFNFPDDEIRRSRGRRHPDGWPRSGWQPALRGLLSGTESCQQRHLRNPLVASRARWSPYSRRRSMTGRTSPRGAPWRRHYCHK